MGIHFSYADTYTYGYSYSNAHSDAYSHLHSYSYSHTYGYSYSYSHTYGYSYSYSHTYGYSYSHTYGYSYSHTYGYSYSYSHTYAKSRAKFISFCNNHGFHPALAKNTSALARFRFLNHVSSSNCERKKKTEIMLTMNCEISFHPRLTKLTFL
jgi:hypothetical protein